MGIIRVSRDPKRGHGPQETGSNRAYIRYSEKASEFLVNVIISSDAHGSPLKAGSRVALSYDDVEDRWCIAEDEDGFALSVYNNDKLKRLRGLIPVSAKRSEMRGFSRDTSHHFSLKPWNGVSFIMNPKT